MRRGPRNRNPRGKCNAYPTFFYFVLINKQTNMISALILILTLCVIMGIATGNSTDTGRRCT